MSSVTGFRGCARRTFFFTVNPSLVMGRDSVT